MVALSAMRKIALASVAVTFVLVTTWFTVKSSDPEARHKIRRGTKHRVAVVIPFLGEGPESIPPYLSLFCEAAKGSASLVDFLLIHNGALAAYTEEPPENVRLINLGSTRALAEKLVKVTDRREDMKMSSTSLAKVLTKFLENYPYILVEYKPSFGHVFSEYLAEYSHWAYSDLDIAFGDLPRWITSDELENFDIVTYGYGDQNRAYMRGQFTFHKNTERVNQIWRGCSYLSKLDRRLDQIVSGEKKLHLESAEGCYSLAVFQQNDIKVKYAVKAFTDVQKNDSVYKHGLFLGIGKQRDKSVIYKASSAQDGRSLLHVSPTWFEENKVYTDPSRPLQKEIGEMELIQVDADSNAKCMYWVQTRYQSTLCLAGDVESTHTIFLLNGKLYKQRYEMEALPEGIISAPFFHFQEWKRVYREGQLSAIDRAAAPLTWVLCKEGAIPAHPTKAQNRQHDMSPLGIKASRWKEGNDFRKRLLPHARYCVRSGRRENPPFPPAPACYEIVSWQDYDSVEIVKSAPEWKHISATTEVTLVLTLQISANQTEDENALRGMLGLAIDNVHVWQDHPCVLVIHIAGATARSRSAVRDQMGYLDHDKCLVAVIAGATEETVSRKALINMATDVAPTRWVVSGLEIERGLVLSTEAVLFCSRRALIHGDMTGNVLIIPQFAVNDGGSLEGFVSVSTLAEMREHETPRIMDPADFEGGNCDGDGDDTETYSSMFLSVNKFWWELTMPEIGGEIAGLENAAVARTLEDFQLLFASLLTKDKHFELSASDSSPILMVDSAGPKEAGIKISTLVREVEEFGGKQCYNTMRLAQLAALGHNINVVPGAFAVSTHRSRAVALKEDASGSSRCDGCFMFDTDDGAGQNILEAIVLDERKRPAKTAIMWDEMAGLGLQ